MKIVRDANTGVVRQEVWTSNGLTSRVGGPALVCRNATGRVVEEAWMIGGKLHRTGGERASFGMSDQGVVFYENWAENGLYHRDGDLPADIMRSTETGKTLFESWHQHGLCHREGGKPAVINYLENGEIESAEWYWHGEAYDTVQQGRSTPPQQPLGTSHSRTIGYDGDVIPTGLQARPKPTGP